MTGLFVGIDTPARVVSAALIIAVGANTEGRREVLYMQIRTSEAEPICTEFLCKLTRRDCAA